jgi:hypothetical protein
MANSLGIELDGKIVVLKKDTFRPEYQDIKFRLWKITGGFGAASFTLGTALFGECLADGEKARHSGYDVERLATEDEIKQYSK